MPKMTVITFQTKPQQPKKHNFQFCCWTLAITHLSRQGIISTDRYKENYIKLRINAADKNASNAQDKAIADVYGNKFIIPLDFEMLNNAAPFYQAGLGNRLCYELTFNDYN